MSEILTEKKVLKMLGADNFRNLTKDQIIEFISNIPNMDKELAMKCLDKIPFYTDCASKVTETYFKLCDSIFNAEINDLEKVEVDAYKTIIDSCRDRIFKYEKNGIPMTHEEYMDLMSTMQEAAEGISLSNNRLINFKKHIINIASSMAFFTIGGVATILGVKIKLPKI